MPCLPHATDGERSTDPGSGRMGGERRAARFSVALHGAAELLGIMLAEGIAREEIEAALATLLDDIERGIGEDEAMGGPPQGSA